MLIDKTNNINNIGGGNAFVLKKPINMNHISNERPSTSCGYTNEEISTLNSARRSFVSTTHNNISNYKLIK